MCKPQMLIRRGGTERPPASLRKLNQRVQHHRLLLAMPPIANRDAVENLIHPKIFAEEYAVVLGALSSEVSRDPIL